MNPAQPFVSSQEAVLRESRLPEPGPGGQSVGSTGRLLSRRISKEPLEPGFHFLAPKIDLNPGVLLLGGMHLGLSLSWGGDVRSQLFFFGGPAP